MKRIVILRFLLILITVFCSKPFYAQDFEIVADNWTKRRAITDTIKPGTGRPRGRPRRRTFRPPSARPAPWRGPP